VSLPGSERKQEAQYTEEKQEHTQVMTESPHTFPFLHEGKKKGFKKILSSVL